MRLVRPLIAVLVTAGLLAPSSAIADTPPKAPMQVKLKQVNLDMRDYTFPSGLRVIFQEDHSEPVVALTMTIDHGSQDDPQGLEGIAHLIEHLWFRSVQPGTDGKDLPKVMDLIKQMGAQFNATTSEDRTNYLTVARSELLMPLMGMESLRLRDAIRKVTNENVLIEREVVRNELRLRYENGGASGWTLLAALLWPAGHPYHRGTIGSHDSLNAITLKDIQDYVAKYYHPSESTLVVAGDLKLDDSTKYLEGFGIDQLAAKDDPEGKNLQLIAPKPRVAEAPLEPPEPAQPIEVKGEVTNLTTLHAAVEKRTIMLGWALPSSYNRTDAVAQAAATQLNLAITRELYPSWEYGKEDSPVDDTAQGCGVSQGRYGTTGYCFIEIPDEEDAPKMVERALNGIYSIWVRDEAYSQFQDYIFSYSQQAGMAQVLQLTDEVTDLFAGRSALVSDFVHYTADPLFYSKQITWVNSINSDEVRAFAEKYFQRKRAVALVMEPYEDGDITLDGSDSAYRGQSRDESILTLFNPEQVNEQAIKDTIVVPDTKSIRQETLANGVKVVVMPHGNGPIVQMGVSFDGGTGSADMDRLQSRFARDNWAYPHYGTVDPLKIAGGDGSFYSSLNTYLAGNAASGNVRDLAYVLRFRLDDTIAWTDGRIDFVKGGKKEILKWMKKPQDASGILQMQRLFAGHPYGEFLTHADWDKMDKMGVKDVQTWLARVLRPENATVIVVGNVDAQEASEAVKTYFGGWTGWGKKPEGWTAPKAEWAPPPAPPQRQVVLFNKDNVSQTDVTYMCQVAPITPENEWAAQIMADVIGDALWLALREQTGASYGAYGYVSYEPGGIGWFMQGVQVQNDTTSFAVKTFLDQGEKAKAMKLDDRWVATQKFNNAQAYVLGQVSTDAMFNRLLRIANRGLSFDYFDQIAPRIAKVSQADFPALLEPCVGHEVVTAVGPVAVIKPGFEKLGIPVEVFDLDAYRKDYRAKMGLKPEKEEKKKEGKK